MGEPHNRRWFLGTAAAAVPAVAWRPWHRRRAAYAGIACGAGSAAGVLPASAGAAVAYAATAGAGGSVPVAIVNTAIFNSTFTLGTTQPDATNTGYRALGYTPSSLIDVPQGSAPAVSGVSANANGDIVVSADGTVLQGYRFHAMVQINANNCTIQGCHVVSYPLHPYPGTTHYGLVSTGGTGNVIQYCDIGLWDDFDLTDNSGYAVVGSVTPYWPVGVLLTGGSATVYRCNIHDTNDTVYCTAGTHQVQGNYLHDHMFRNDDGDQAGNAALPYWSHNDGFQIMGGTNHIVDGNNFVLKFSDNTGMNQSGSVPGFGTGNPNPNPAVEQQWPNCHGVFVQTHNNPVSGVQITRNWFKYGTNAITFTTGSFDPAGAITVTGNRFTPDQGKQFSLYRQVSLTTTTAFPSVTFDNSNVYSTDSDTPAAVQGLPLNGNPPGNPGTVSGVEAWAYNQGAHTGNIPLSLTSP